MLSVVNLTGQSSFHLVIDVWILEATAADKTGRISGNVSSPSGISTQSLAEVIEYLVYLGTVARHLHVVI